MSESHPPVPPVPRSLGILPAVLWHDVSIQFVPDPDEPGMWKAELPGWVKGDDHEVLQVEAVLPGFTPWPDGVMIKIDSPKIVNFEAYLRDGRWAAAPGHHYPARCVKMVFPGAGIFSAIAFFRIYKPKES